MGLVKDAHQNGYSQCLEDLGIEKTAFIGGLVRGAGMAIRGAGKLVGAGSRNLGLTGSRQVGSVASGVGKNVPKFNKKLGTDQILQNRKQFMQGDTIRQKGLLNGMKFSTKAEIAGGVGIMGAGMAGKKLNAIAGGDRRVLQRRIPRNRAPGSSYVRG